MEVITIRPPLVYGPGVNANFAALMRAVQRGWPLPLGALHNQQSFVALENLVDFIVTASLTPKRLTRLFWSVTEKIFQRQIKFGDWPAPWIALHAYCCSKVRAYGWRHHSR
jgi:nucleoside-diphosphate-sugar epimerase